MSQWLPSVDSYEADRLLPNAVTPWTFLNGFRFLDFFLCDHVKRSEKKDGVETITRGEVIVQYTATVLCLVQRLWYTTFSYLKQNLSKALLFLISISELFVYVVEM